MHLSFLYASCCLIINQTCSHEGASSSIHKIHCQQVQEYKKNETILLYVCVVSFFCAEWKVTEWKIKSMKKLCRNICVIKCLMILRDKTRENGLRDVTTKMFTCQILFDKPFAVAAFFLFPKKKFTFILCFLQP